MPSAPPATTRKAALKNVIKTAKCDTAERSSLTFLSQVTAGADDSSGVVYCGTDSQSDIKAAVP